MTDHTWLLPARSDTRKIKEPPVIGGSFIQPRSN